MNTQTRLTLVRLGEVDRTAILNESYPKVLRRYKTGKLVHSLVEGPQRAEIETVDGDMVILEAMVVRDGLGGEK